VTNLHALGNQALHDNASAMMRLHNLFTEYDATVNDPRRYQLGVVMREQLDVAQSAIDQLRRLPLVNGTSIANCK